MSPPPARRRSARLALPEAAFGEWSCDLAEVRGQEAAKRALEIALAGGHHILLDGPPGAGKTLLGRCIPGLLPPLSATEAEELARIYLRAGLSPPSVRPVRRPQPTASVTRLVGDGARRRPAEASLAHSGVLCLDDLPAFGSRALAALCRPLDEGEVVFASPSPPATMPARFVLFATATPCPCGFLNDWRGPCRCSAAARRRDRSRVPGALLDRIDLHVEVPAVSLSELRSRYGEASSTVAVRIAAARALQADRFGGPGTNGAMGLESLRRHCPLDAASLWHLDGGIATLRLSARAAASVLRVARTIADLAGGGEIRKAHVGEAIQYSTHRPHVAPLLQQEEASREAST